jgi:hypothetical protein
MNNELRLGKIAGFVGGLFRLTLTFKRVIFSFVVGPGS